MTQPVETPKVALITGVGPGLGDAICRRLARAGFAVVGLARSAAFGATLTDAIAADGGTYRHIAADVTDPAAVAAAGADIAGREGPVSVLVHNAAALLIKPFAETTPEAFERIWRVSCFGAMVAARAVLPGMEAADAGAIVVTGATAGVRGGADFAAFASAKFALRGLTQTLARAYGPKGIHVAHVIIDGLILGPQTTQRFNPDPARCIDPAAIADTYLHLIEQPPSCWTYELDLRPHSERF